MTRHEWKKVCMRDIADMNPESINKSFSYSEIEYIDISSVGTGTLSGTEVLNIKEAPSRAKRLVKTGDTILSTVRPNRRSFYFIKKSKPNLVVSTGFAVLRAKSNIDSKYLYYLINDQRFSDYLTACAKGAAYPAVDSEIIERAEITIPVEASEQKKISSILANYDNLIENNSRRIQLLDNMVKLIYDEWFIKFKFSGHESVKMVESKLGKIPAGWKIVSLNDVANIQVGYPFKSKSFCEDKTLKPIVRIRDILNNSTDTFSDEEVDNKYEIHSGDMLIGMDGIFHICVWSNKVAYLNQRVARLRPINGVSKYFLLLSVKPKIERLNDVIVGTTVQHLSQRDFDKMNILLPPMELMDSFRKYVDTMFDNEIKLRQKNMNLAATRDLLLPKLISSELDVSELDIKVSEVEI